MIYKLTKAEFLQAIADYLTKKYYITDEYESDMNLQIDGKTGGLIVTAKKGSGL